MSEEPTQNYANHARIDKPIFAIPLLFVAALILSGIDVVMSFNFTSLGLFLLIPALFLLAFRTRQYPIVVQDRVIQLEMRLRLAKLLEGDLEARIGELTRPQLIGLRFASDGELPDLVKKVLDEKIAKGDDIKKLVKDWQPDHMRM